MPLARLAGLGHPAADRRGQDHPERKPDSGHDDDTRVPWAISLREITRKARESRSVNRIALAGRTSSRRGTPASPTATSGTVNSANRNPNTIPGARHLEPAADQVAADDPEDEPQPGRPGPHDPRRSWRYSDSPSSTCRPPLRVPDETRAASRRQASGLADPRTNLARIGLLSQGGLPNRNKIRSLLPGFRHDRGNDASVLSRSVRRTTSGWGRFLRSNLICGREISP